MPTHPLTGPTHSCRSATSARRSNRGARAMRRNHFSVGPAPTPLPAALAVQAPRRSLLRVPGLLPTVARVAGKLNRRKAASLLEQAQLHRDRAEWTKVEAVLAPVVAE